MPKNGINSTDIAQQARALQKTLERTNRDLTEDEAEALTDLVSWMNDEGMLGGDIDEEEDDEESEEEEEDEDEEDWPEEEDEEEEESEVV